MPVQVEVLQYFVDKTHSETMPVLPVAYALSGTETPYARVRTFGNNFLTLIFVAECRRQKALLHLIIPVIVKKGLLLECKPLGDWQKVYIVQDNGAYIHGVNPDPVLLAVDDELLRHKMVCHKSNPQDSQAPLQPAHVSTIGCDMHIALELGAMGRAREKQQ